VVGFEDGITEGLADGLGLGRADGLALGVAEGLAEGPKERAVVGDGKPEGLMQSGAVATRQVLDAPTV
jgi:hypothetical protein